MLKQAWYTALQDLPGKPPQNTTVLQSHFVATVAVSPIAIFFATTAPIRSTILVPGFPPLSTLLRERLDPLRLLRRTATPGRRNFDQRVTNDARHRPGQPFLLPHLYIYPPNNGQPTVMMVFSTPSKLHHTSAQHKGMRTHCLRQVRACALRANLFTKI